MLVEWTGPSGSLHGQMRNAGEIYDLGDDVAVELINRGLVVAVEVKKPVITVPPASVTVTNVKNANAVDIGSSTSKDEEN